MPAEWSVLFVQNPGPEEFAFRFSAPQEVKRVGINYVSHLKTRNETERKSVKAAIKFLFSSFDSFPHPAI